MSDATLPRRPRRELWLLALITIVPVVASYFAYYVWRPEGLKNYGELITPPIPLRGLAAGGDAIAPPFDTDPLKGRWVLVMVDSGGCDATCKSKLWQIRQLRLTQGVDMERIERVWLVDDGAAPDPGLLTEYEGTVVMQARASALIDKLSTTDAQRDHLFLVDPLGNLMMRFPKNADPNRIKKDLGQLLKVSRIG